MNLLYVDSSSVSGSSDFDRQDSIALPCSVDYAGNWHSAATDDIQGSIKLLLSLSNGSGEGGRLVSFDPRLSEVACCRVR
jgi:hypothetical protein